MSGGQIRGVAPEANLVVLKVLDDAGNGKLNHMLSGIAWLEQNWKKYGIRVVNISVGAVSRQMDNEGSKLVKAVDRLWDLGMVVCVAAGNEGGKGRKSTVTTPGICRKAITVGSSDDAAMTDSYGKNYYHYSGKGPTKSCICKPEIVAPGTNMLAANAMNEKNSKPYAIKSGTSMSTPIVSGAVALLLEKYPNMENREVKLRLRRTAKDLGLPSNHQGWGMINISGLIHESAGGRNG